MRSVYLLLCASVAVISAGHLGNRDHEFIGHQAVQHRIERRTLQQKRDAVVSNQVTLPSIVPAGVTGAFTVSNTLPAAPQATSAAVGATTVKTIPLTCSSFSPIGGVCDLSNNGGCCVIGSRCVANTCRPICTIDTLESYCDSTTPCNAAIGYLCTANRCRPPALAVRVLVGATCDQGMGNTLFCLPSKAICLNSVCTACVQ